MLISKWFSYCGCSGAKLCPTLWPHWLQHTRLPCPSLSLTVCSHSCPLTQWCYPTISSSVIPFSSCPQSFPISVSFPMSRLFPIRWPKYWNFCFSISPSSEYSGLISFRIDWLDFLAVQDTRKSSPAPQFENVNSLALSLSYGSTLTSVHDYWKNHRFDYMDLCQQSDFSAF